MQVDIGIVAKLAAIDALLVKLLTVHFGNDVFHKVKLSLTREANISNLEGRVLSFLLKRIITVRRSTSLDLFQGKRNHQMRALVFGNHVATAIGLSFDIFQCK